MPSKQADRNAQKRGAKNATAVEEPQAAKVATPSMLMDFAKILVKDSVLLEYTPKLLRVLKTEGGILSGAVNKVVPPASKEETKDDTDENTEDNEGSDEKQTEPKDAATSPDSTDHAVEMFKAMKSRLVWHNALALSAPVTSVDSKTMWTALKSLEVDYGPRPSKRGSPKMDRIVTNLYNFLPQYLHALLFVFMLNCLLFRSWFACLPWLFFYQTLSLAVPLDTLEKLPQAPLSKIPLKFRLAGTMAIHVFVWLFFLYEAVWKCNFLIEFWAIGLIVAHALCVVPASLAN